MAAPVELDPVPVQDAEHARAAAIAADLPYIVDRVTGVVHAHDGLLLLHPDPFLLRLGFHVLAPLEHPGLGPANQCRLMRKAADDIQH